MRRGENIGGGDDAVYGPRGRRTGRRRRRRGRFFFTPTSALLRRVGIYGGLMFFLIVVQTSLPFIPLFEGAVPNLVLAAAAAIGFFDSERAGAVAGIAAGFVLDSLGGTSLSLMPVAGLAVGYICGVCAGTLLPRAVLPFSFCLGGVSVLNSLLTVVCTYAAVSEVRPWIMISHTLLPELFFTFLLGIPAALLALLCAKWAGKTKRKRAITLYNQKIL